MFDNLTPAQARKLWLMLGKAQAQCATIIRIASGEPRTITRYVELLNEFRDLRAELPVRSAAP